MSKIPEWASNDCISTIETHEDQLDAMVIHAGADGYKACGCPPSAWDRIYYALQATFPDATDEQHRLATDYIVGKELLP